MMMTILCHSVRLLKSVASYFLFILNLIKLIDLENVLGRKCFPSKLIAQLFYSNLPA